MPWEFESEEGLAHEHQSLANELSAHVQKTGDLSALVFGALQRDECSAGIHAADHNKTGVLLMFYKTNRPETGPWTSDPLGRVWIKAEEIFAEYPNLVPVEEALAAREEDEKEKWFDARDKKLGMTEECAFIHRVVSAGIAMELAFSYALSSIGSALFELPSSEDLYGFLDYIGDHERDPQRYIYVSLEYTEYVKPAEHKANKNKALQGWGENFVTFLPEQDSSNCESVTTSKCTVPECENLASRAAGSSTI